MAYCLTRNHLKATMSGAIDFVKPRDVEKVADRRSVFMTGSDQVWNSGYNEGTDRVFYLSFAPAGARKVAYAASIGHDRLDESEKREMSGLLSEYDRITVRETSAQTQLKEMGLDADLVLDPTLLLTKEEWTGSIRRSGFRKTEPYVLIYSVERYKNAELVRIAREVARDKGLKVYAFFADMFMPGIDSDRKFTFGSVALFIDLLANADFMVVSSFHGTAFSINFNKEFLTVLPDSYSSRARSLLSLTGLEERIYAADKKAWNENTDYTKANAVIESKRRESEAILKDLIS